MVAWNHGRLVTQEKIGGKPPYQHIRLARSEPSATLGAMAGTIGRDNRQIAGISEGLGRSGDAARAAPGLMGEAGAVRLTAAGAGVGRHEQGGDPDVPGGRG